MKDEMFVRPSLPFLMVSMVIGYPSGPPETSYICKEMFPVGHQTDAQFSDPPYEIDMSQNVYTPWEEIRITLRGKQGYHISGFMMQARRANCGHQYQKEPLGTFQLMPNERYLRTIPCMNRINSTIGHRINPGLQQAVFKWFAPAANLGHIYFVATVVMEQKIFWTTLYSEILRDLSSTSGRTDKCPARVLLDPTSGSHTTPWPELGSTEQSRGHNNSDNLRTSIILTLFGVMAAGCTVAR